MSNNPENKPPSSEDSVFGVFASFFNNPVNIQKLTFFAFFWIILVSIALLAYTPIGPIIKPFVALIMPINENSYPWYIKIAIISGLYWVVVITFWVFSGTSSKDD